MHKVLRYSQLLGLVALAAVVAVLSLLYRGLVFESLVEGETRSNVALTRTFANVIWPVYRDFLTHASSIPRAKLATRAEIGLIDHDLRQLAQGLSVVKVKIYDIDGFTVYSSDARQIGEDKSANPGFRSARGGAPASDITFRNRFDAWEGTLSDRNIIGTYVPIRSHDAAPIEGVLEVYSDVTVLMGDMERGQWKILGGGVVAMMVLYLVMQLMLGRYRRLLARQEKERIAQQEQLRESELRFRSLTEMSSDFYWETDTAHRLTQMVFGGRYQYQRVHSPGSQLGKTRWELPSSRPDAAGWDAHKATLEARQPFHDFCISRFDTDANERHLILSGDPIFDKRGGFIGYRGVGRNITEQRLAEERQAAHARHQERVAEFGRHALGLHEVQALLDAAVLGLSRGLDADAVAYCELTPDEDKVAMRAGIGCAPDGDVFTTTLHDAIGHTLKSGEAAVLESQEQPDLRFPCDWARELQSSVIVPVRGELRLYGVLCALSARRKAYGGAEAGFVAAMASVLSAALQRIESEQRLAHLAQFDNLTGLPNRALLLDRFGQVVAQAKRHASLLGVMFVDLDHFKLVNDTLGHAAGDELLKEAARRLSACTRSGDTVARISGDEFVVILNELAQAEHAASVAQKIIERLAAPFSIAGQESFVSASIGIAVYPGDGGDAEALLGAADAAMYRAKESGRNSYCYFTAGITQSTRARLQLGGELRRALEREEFRLFYQPKVALKNRALKGVEALLRWAHPERGLVSPAEFIPALEETGLIVAVGEWVLRQACADIKAWRAAGLEPVPVAVNLSARQFQNRDLDRRILGIIEESGIEPGLIELEITESQLMQDPEHAIRVVNALSQAGVRFAIDDFGTGYSSLSYLTRFPVSALKIDRSFVKDIESDTHDAVIVRTIVEMAHTLGFIVVAEGVETENQSAFLNKLDCEQAQGYLFARPMPGEQFAALLARAGDQVKPLRRLA